VVSFLQVYQLEIVCCGKSQKSAISCSHPTNFWRKVQNMKLPFCRSSCSVINRINKMQNQRTLAQYMWCERRNSWLSPVHGRTLSFCPSLSHSSCCYALQVRQLVIGICLIGLPCSRVVSTYPHTHTHTHTHTYIYTRLCETYKMAATTLE